MEDQNTYVLLQCGLSVETRVDVDEWKLGVFTIATRRERIFDSLTCAPNILPGIGVVTMKLSVEGLEPHRYRV